MLWCEDLVYFLSFLNVKLYEREFHAQGVLDDMVQLSPHGVQMVHICYRSYPVYLLLSILQKNVFATLFIPVVLVGVCHPFCRDAC